MAKALGALLFLCCVCAQAGYVPSVQEPSQLPEFVLGLVGVGAGYFVWRKLARHQG